MVVMTRGGVGKSSRLIYDHHHIAMASPPPPPPPPPPPGMMEIIVPSRDVRRGMAEAAAAAARKRRPQPPPSRGGEVTDAILEAMRASADPSLRAKIALREQFLRDDRWVLLNRELTEALASTDRFAAVQARLFKAQLQLRETFLSERDEMVRRSGRPASLPEDIYLALGAMCNNYRPDLAMARGYGFIYERGDSRDQDLVEIVRRLNSHPEVIDFAGYEKVARLRPCVENLQQKARAEDAARQQQESRTEEAERSRQLELWRRVGLQRQIHEWWTLRAKPIIESQKKRFTRDMSEEERAALSRRILKDVEQQLREGWGRAFGTVAPLPPFWSSMMSNDGVYDDPFTGEHLDLNIMLPGWNTKPRVQSIDDALERIRELEGKLADAARTMSPPPAESMTAGAALLETQIAKKDAEIAALREKIETAMSQEELNQLDYTLVRAKRVRSIYQDTLMRVLDILRNKIARRTLVS